MSILGKIKTLKDKTGNYIFPQTTSDAVICSDGKNIDTKFSEVNSQLDTNIRHTHGWINVKEFKCSDGQFVQGDGIHDDTSGIQKALIYAFKNNLKVKFPGGRYLISKTLMVIANSNEVLSSIILEGDSVETTRLQTTENFSSLSDTSPYNVKTLFMLVDESCINEEGEFIVGNTGNSVSSIQIKNMMLLNSDNGTVDYGIYCPIGVFSSKFSMMRIRNFKTCGFKTNNNFFLNILEKIRVEKSPTSFDIKSGICTSNKLDSCYSVNASVTGYKIGGIYSTLINCCCDACTGICYDLSGFVGEVISPGAESQLCTCVFNSNADTKVSIINPYTFGNFDSESAMQIFGGISSNITVIGGILGHDWRNEGRIMPGYLYRTSGKASIKFINVEFGKYTKANDRIDDNSYGSVNNKKANLMFRNAGKISYLGFDGGNGSEREKKGYYDDSSTNSYGLGSAIFMGLGDSVSTLSDGTSIRYNGANAKGDLLLTKNPENIRGIGWVQTGQGSDWNGGLYRKIPFIDSGSTENRPTTGLVLGQPYFDTTLGIPIYWNGGVWKKYSDDTTV